MELTNDELHVIWQSLYLKWIDKKIEIQKIEKQLQSDKPLVESGCDCGGHTFVGEKKICVLTDRLKDTNEEAEKINVLWEKVGEELELRIFGTVDKTKNKMWGT